MAFKLVLLGMIVSQSLALPTGAADVDQALCAGREARLAPDGSHCICTLPHSCRGSACTAGHNHKNVPVSGWQPTRCKDCECALSAEGLACGDSVTWGPAELTMPLKSERCPRAALWGGSETDGGWHVCDPTEQPPDGRRRVVYSYGINNDFVFDAAAAAAGCEVHGFDPTPMGLVSKPAYDKIPGATYHSYGMAGFDAVFAPGTAPFRWPGVGYLTDTNTVPWELKSVSGTMQSLGHARVDILKMDVEGAEWDGMASAPLEVTGDWMVELHFPPIEGYVLTPTPSGGLHIKRTADSQKVACTRDRPGYGGMAKDRAPWIDRIALLHKLLRTHEMWKFELNGRQCVNTYFKRIAH